MLALHTLFLCGLVIGCLVSPFIALSYPEAFNFYALWVFGGLGVLILGSWYIYRGECPLTVWENQFKKIEGRETYAEPCMDRYAKRWFGVRLPWRFSDIFPIAILAIPLLTRLFI